MQLINQTAILEDAVAQVLIDPGAAHRWHRLMPLYRQALPAWRAEVRAALQAGVPAGGPAAFVHATFLLSADNDDDQCARAAQILLEMQPFDGDRIAAFVTFAWARMLQASSGHVDFVAALRAARFPALLHRAGHELRMRMPQRPVRRPLGAVQRVAIIATQMSNCSHAPTALALDQAAVLTRLGIQAEIFSCQEHSLRDMAQLLGGGEESTVPAPDVRDWYQRVRLALRVHLADTSLSLMRRHCDMLAAITAYDPDLVLLVGMYSPLIAPLYDSRPVVGLSVHATVPIACQDVALFADPNRAGHLGRDWEPCMPPALLWHHPFRIAVRTTGDAVTRSTLGLAEDALVMVTVGFRLETEITGAWAACMIETLRAMPNLTWLLIGGAGILPTALSDAPAAQVRVMATQADVPSILKRCDVYLNPTRIGGGFSVAEAMAMALPVVALAGSDGGNKIGDAAVADVAQSVALLHALLQDADLRAVSGLAMRALFAATLDAERSGPSLLGAFDAALSRFAQRTHPRPDSAFS